MNDKKYVPQYEKVPIKEKEANKEHSNEVEAYGYGVRHVQVFLAFLSLSVGFIARGHLGVTVVAMTSHKNATSNNITIHNNNNSQVFTNNTTVWEDVDYENAEFDAEISENITGIPFINKTIEATRDEIRYNFETYDWPKSTQEMVLGAFFLGYCIMMFPMGMVCQRWGGKLPMQVALFVNGVTSILTPWLASWGGWKAVCACRILQGFSQAGYYPSLQTLVSKWSHPSERCTLVSYVYTGTTVGTVIAFQLAGFLAASPWGWPSTYWATGGLCLLMFVILSIFGAASPSEHKSISEKEKNYIMGNAEKEVQRRRRIPWKAIFKSRHVWASISTHIGSGLAFVFFFNQVPSYIHYILDMDLKKSGLFSSLPYVASFVMSILYGTMSDYLTNKKILSVANARKLSNSIAEVGIAVCYISVSYTTNVQLALACLILALAFHAAVHTGWMVNHIDLSPNFSSTLMAIGNTICCAAVLLVPVMVSLVVSDVTNQLQWRIVFITMAGLAFITNLIFVIFMSSDTQPWNESDYEEADREECNKDDKLTR